MAAPLTPNQAAQVAATSRWSIRRAIRNHELKAYQDNQNVWRIEPAELERWRADRERTVAPPPLSHPPTAPPPPHPAETEAATLRGELAEVRVELAGAKAEVAGLRDRLADTATERDAWKTLASQPWWRRLW